MDFDPGASMKGWWGGHKVIDPSEMESRFSTEDGLGSMDVCYNEYMDEEEEAQMEKVRDALASIPSREADFIDLYIFKKRKQTDIAAIFGVSQPTVSYRLKRAEARIRYLIELPVIADGELDRMLEQVLDDPLDIRIMVLMHETTCQSEVAKQLGVSQGLVRHRFIRAIGKLEKVEGYEKYVQLFQFVYQNLNILREVQRPQWNATVTHMLGTR